MAVHGPAPSLDIRFARRRPPAWARDEPCWVPHSGPSYKVVGAENSVCREFGIRVIKAPVRAPKARAHAERWVGSARRECLGRLHLHHVLAADVAHYNEHRPHRSLRQRPPLATQMTSAERPVAAVSDLERVRRRDLLGGLIHEYQLAA
jgi:putative transposase